MKIDFATYKNNSIFYLFLFSLFVGSGISYGKIYLFHLVLPIAIFTGFIKKRTLSIYIDRKYVGFFLFYAIIFVTSLICLRDYKFIYFYSVSFSILITLILFSNYISKNFTEIILFLFLLLSIDFVIGFLEVFAVFRYPISRYSSVNSFFNIDFSYTVSKLNQNFIPTGFHWNENDFSFVLLLFVPFLKLYFNRIFKNIILCIIIFLILMASSKIGLVAILIFILLTFYQEIKEKNYFYLIIFSFVLSFLINIYQLFGIHNQKLKEVSLVQYISLDLKNGAKEKIKSKNSSNAIRGKINNLGLNKLKKNILFGEGAGYFVHELTDYKNTIKQERFVNSPHNFILEILVDFGLIILVPIGFIIFQIYRRFKFLNKNKKFSFTLFFVMLVPMSIMTSSLVYFLPFYLFLFLIIIYILQKDTKTSNDFEEK